MNARMSALRVLTACWKNGAWADAALAAELSRENGTAADAALTSRIVYGVLQHRYRIDYDLSACCTQRLSHLQEPLPDILRIGAEQILFLDKIPDRAAISESVELAKQSNRSAAAGLVNAVLRKLAAGQTAPLPTSPLERLRIETSHPLWFVQRITDLLGMAEGSAFLQKNNEIAPLTIQVNPLCMTQEELVTQLPRVSAHSWIPGCLELDHVGDPSTLPAFIHGGFTVQDGAARLVSLVGGIQPDMRVLDVCAAPGGKSFSAAFDMMDRGEIVACDLHEKKLNRIRSAAKRLGLSCIRTETSDGRLFRSEWEKAFDVVICDVPCSGLGIIRKKPDIRYKEPRSFSTLPNLQYAILSNSARYVKPGGTLLYSTCTVLPEENEQVTDRFLRENTVFAYEPFPLPTFSEPIDGRLTLWPQRHDTDGFYISKMRRLA